MTLRLASRTGRAAGRTANMPLRGGAPAGDFAPGRQAEHGAVAGSCRAACSPSTRSSSSSTRPAQHGVLRLGRRDIDNNAATLAERVRQALGAAPL
jgi:hypothetical protein